MSDESVAHASSQDVSKSVIIELGSTLVWLRLCAKTVGSSLVSSQMLAKIDRFIEGSASFKGICWYV